MFYTYRQNNSGGSFKITKKIKHYVIIEADSASEADEKAESIGIYFDGVEKGRDCPCCGDRWHKAYSLGYGIEGTKEPEIWGQSVMDFLKQEVDADGSLPWNEEVIIYYKNGKVEVFSEKDLYGK